MLDQCDEEKQLSDEEKERLIKESAEKFARLFLEQVLWKRQQEKRKNDK